MATLHHPGDVIVGTIDFNNRFLKHEVIAHAEKLAGLADQKRIERLEVVNHGSHEQWRICFRYRFDGKGDTYRRIVTNLTRELGMLQQGNNVSWSITNDVTEVKL